MITIKLLIGDPLRVNAQKSNALKHLSSFLLLRKKEALKMCYLCVAGSDGRSLKRAVYGRFELDILLKILS